MPQNCVRRATCVAFLLLVSIVLLAPVWSVAYPPLLDYPNHLAGSFVLAHLHDAHFQFSRFYLEEWGFYPSIAMDPMLLVLQKVVPVDWAGRILLSLCLLSMPLGAWFFLRHANPGHDGLALWSLVISFNSFFLLGYLGYYLSIGVGFGALALWLRYLVRPSTAKLGVLVGVLIALYLLHLIGFIMTGLMMTTYTLLNRQPIRRVLVSCLLFLPGLLPYLLSRAGSDAHAFAYPSLIGKALKLLGFLRVHSVPLDLVILLVLAACVTVALWRNVDLRWNREWVGVATALFGAYWLLPIGVGAAYDFYNRVLPFLFIVLLAVVRVGSKARWLAVGAVFLFLVRTTYVTRQFVVEQPRLASLARSFDVTTPNARVLPVIESTDDQSFLFPDNHFWAYGIIRRGWLSPYLFGISDAQSGAPLRLRTGIYAPDGFWGDRYDEPPRWDRVRDAYDYVWAYNVRGFSPQLEAIGTLVFAQGNLKVYRIHRAPSTGQ